MCVLVFVLVFALMYVFLPARTRPCTPYAPTHTELPTHTQTLTHIGVLFRLVWLNIDGTGLDGFCSIYQGHLFSKRPPMLSHSVRGRVCVCQSTGPVG